MVSVILTEANAGGRISGSIGESDFLPEIAEETDIDKPENSDIIEGNIPYLNSRPTYADGQVEAVWELWKSADGKVYDPSGQEIIWGIFPGKNMRKFIGDMSKGK